MVVPLSRRERRLADLNAVRVTRQAVKGGSTNTVLLVGRDMSLEVAGSPSRADAFALAKELAAFLRLPILDASAGPPIRLDWNQLDQTAIERWRADGDAPEVPVGNGRMASVCREQGDRVVIEIEPLAPNPWRETVTVTPDRLVAEHWCSYAFAGRISRKSEIPVAELIELVVATQAPVPAARVAANDASVHVGGIVALGASDVACFAAGLPEDETRYLYAVVRAFLCRRGARAASPAGRQGSG